MSVTSSRVMVTWTYGQAVREKTVWAELVEPQTQLTVERGGRHPASTRAAVIIIIIGTGNIHLENAS